MTSAGLRLCSSSLSSLSVVKERKEMGGDGRGEDEVEGGRSSEIGDMYFWSA